jgi:hypothetical protein
MASSGKKKTTMAKLMRESRLRERRLDKQARKDARKSAAAAGLTEPAEDWTDGGDEVDEAGEAADATDAGPTESPASETIAAGRTDT